VEQRIVRILLTDCKRLVVIPLSFLRRLDSLKYTSVIALISIGYLVILVVAHFVKGDTMAERGPIRIIKWESGLSVLKSFPVVVFAYTCHQNVRYPVDDSDHRHANLC
jgi:amino acid permease